MSVLLWAQDPFPPRAPSRTQRQELFGDRRGGEVIVLRSPSSFCPPADTHAPADVRSYFGGL